MSVIEWLMRDLMGNFFDQSLYFYIELDSDSRQFIDGDEGSENNDYLKQLARYHVRNLFALGLLSLTVNLIVIQDNLLMVVKVVKAVIVLEQPTSVLREIDS